MTDLAAALRTAGVTHLLISATRDGRWQASFKNPDGSFHVAVADDAATAAFKCLPAPAPATRNEDIFS